MDIEKPTPDAPIQYTGGRSIWVSVNGGEPKEVRPGDTVGKIGDTITEVDKPASKGDWRAQELAEKWRTIFHERPSDAGEAQKWRMLCATVNAYDPRRSRTEDPVMADDSVLNVLCDYARRLGDKR